MPTGSDADGDDGRLTTWQMYRPAAGGLADVDDLEPLGQVTLRQPAMRRRPGQALAQEVLEAVPLPNLAHVGAQRRDLLRERLRHVHIVCGRYGAADPDLRHDPGLQALVGQQLGKRERVACIRVDGVQGRGADRAVIRVADAEPEVVTLRRGADHPLRADLPDHPGQVAARRSVAMSEREMPGSLPPASPSVTRQ